MADKKLFFEDIKIGDEITPLVKNPTTQQLVKYAGASGDYYQIHYDHHFAINSGLPGVISHGLLGMGWLGQLMTNWLPDKTLKKLTTSYRGMTKPGDTVTCKGTITNKYTKDGENLIECEIWAENQNGEKCYVGNATAALPSKS